MKTHHLPLLVRHDDSNSRRCDRSFSKYLCEVVDFFHAESPSNEIEALGIA